jgi:hypothetical protein
MLVGKALPSEVSYPTEQKDGADTLQHPLRSRFRARLIYGERMRVRSGICHVGTVKWSLRKFQRMYAMRPKFS